MSLSMSRQILAVALLAIPAAPAAAQQPAFASGSGPVFGYAQDAPPLQRDAKPAAKARGTAYRTAAPTQAAAPEPSLFSWLSKAFAPNPMTGTTEAVCYGAPPPVDVASFGGQGPFTPQTVDKMQRSTVRIAPQDAQSIDRVLKLELGIRYYDLGSIGDLLNYTQPGPPGIGGGFCTGTLLLSNIVVSAGHCISPRDIVEKEGVPPSVLNSSGAFVRYFSPREIAKILKVEFNYQSSRVATVDPTIVAYAVGTQYFSVPVDDLIEWRYGQTESGSPRDHMVLRIKKAATHDLGDYALGLSRLDYNYVPKGAALAIIQHPKGSPKQIAVGTLKGRDGPRLLYSDIGTEGGSSGAGILNKWGKLVGLHTRGNCSPTQPGGANVGLGISTLRSTLEAFRRTN